MAAESAAVQGSGWGWLGYSKERDAVAIVTTANQDPCIVTGLVPLLGIDVSRRGACLSRPPPPPPLRCRGT
jgi:Fe-Mn family superoxide dismutase